MEKKINSKVMAARKEAFMKRRAEALAARKAAAQAKRPVAKKVAEKAATPKPSMKRTMSRNNLKLKAMAARFSQRLFKLVDATLVDAEQTVKANFPARFVSASLTKLRKQLRDTGICCQFDRTVSRKELRASFDSKVTKVHCDEAVDEIAKCVAAEVEDILESCDQAVTKAAEKNFKMKRMAARQLRAVIRRNLWAKGLEFNW